MEVKVNGEPIRQLHQSLCESNLNATSLSERMCDVADSQIDLTLQGLELMKEYAITLMGMF